MTNKTALIILDGWGIGRPDGNNAVHVASTPCFDRLLSLIHISEPTRLV